MNGYEKEREESYQTRENEREQNLQRTEKERERERNWYDYDMIQNEIDIP